MKDELQRRRLLLALDGRLELGRLTRGERKDLLDAAVQEGVHRLVAARYPELGEPPKSWRAGVVLPGYVTRRAIALLEEAGIACAVLKGVAVAAMAWERPELRPQWDVDLLVAPRDQTRAAEVLQKGGLAGKMKLEGRNWHHLVLYTASPPGLVIEIHRELTVDLPVNVNADDLLARSIRIETPDGELPTLDREDTIVYLALHASVHAMERLQWVVDIAHFVRRQPIDWEVAVMRARTWGIALPVEIAWRQAVVMLSAQIPAAALRELGVPWARRVLSGTLLDGARRAGGAIRQALERAFRLSLVPTPPALASTLRRKLRARAEGQRAAGS